MTTQPRSSDNSIHRYNDDLVVRRSEPEAHLTYHNPHGDSRGGYQVHVWGMPLHTKLEPTEAAAWRAAREVIDDD